MNRPQMHDATVVDAALLPFAKTFQVDKQTDKRGWEQLIKVFQDAYHKSRFEVAKDLDDAGWDVDDDVLDAIEQVTCNHHQVHSQAVKDWVQANAITPKLSVGAEVSVTRRSETHTGTVTSIHEDRAQYVVRIPGLGHVETGIGTHGWVIPFEELHTLVADPAEFKLQTPASG